MKVMSRIAGLACLAACLALAFGLACAGEARAAEVDGIQEMYRLYNPNSGEHFYTASESERDNVIKAGWRYEGVGWGAPAKGGDPVYRLYNPNAGDHHYTTSATERDWLKKKGWRYEGVGWKSDSSQKVAIYRQYNPNAQSGAHNFTASKAEDSHLGKVGWNREGVGWYASATELVTEYGERQWIPNVVTVVDQEAHDEQVTQNYEVLRAQTNNHNGTIQTWDQVFEEGEQIKAEYVSSLTYDEVIAYYKSLKNGVYVSQSDYEAIGKLTYEETTNDGVLVMFTFVPYASSSCRPHTTTIHHEAVTHTEDHGHWYTPVTRQYWK